MNIYTGKTANIYVSTRNHLQKKIYLETPDSRNTRFYPDVKKNLETSVPANRDIDRVETPLNIIPEPQNTPAVEKSVTPVKACFVPKTTEVPCNDIP